MNHDHRFIREQAYLEVGRAPYSSIKVIAGSVPRDRIRGFLVHYRVGKNYKLSPECRLAMGNPHLPGILYLFSESKISKFNFLVDSKAESTVSTSYVAPDKGKYKPMSSDELRS